MTNGRGDCNIENIINANRKTELIGKAKGYKILRNEEFYSLFILHMQVLWICRVISVKKEGENCFWILSMGLLPRV